MAVYDRWHRAPKDGDIPCREHSRGRTKLYPSADHMTGDRWQVRWRDPATGKQLKRNFALKEGKDPARHADAFDTQVQHRIDTRTYTDPKAGEVTLAEYAGTWRASRKLDVNEAADVERRFRLHVNESEPGSGRTRKGGVAIGQHPMGLLAQRPTMISAWITAMPLAPSSAFHVVSDLSAVFRAAVEDGIVGRDPTKASSVTWPRPGRTRARPWAVAQVDAMAAELPGRWKVVPALGAGTAMRQGEMLGLGVDDVVFLGRDPRISVVRALKIIGGELRFGPVKNRREHSVPLAPSVAEALARHLAAYPAREVTLPWHDPDDRERHGRPVTVRLILTKEDGTAVERGTFDYHWRQARGRAGITPPDRRGRDDGCHVLRHTAASSWLRQRIDIVRVAAWMGDTVAMVAKTYSHLMPDDDDEDGRAAVDMFFAGRSAPDVPREAVT